MHELIRSLGQALGGPLRLGARWLFARSGPRAILRVRNNIGRPGCTFTVEFPVPVGKPARLTA